MRGASLRALLLALAMVIQTIAGVSGVAHAGSPSGQKAAIGHCAQSTVDHAIPAPAGDSQKSSCGHCLVCALHAGDAVTSPFSGGIFARAATPSRFEPLGEINPGAFSLEASRARGPPAVRA